MSRPLNSYSQPTGPDPQLPPIVGTEGNDFLWGTEQADEILGLGGDDWLQGFAGDDILRGGHGNDILDGAAGDDTYVFDLDDGQDLVRTGNPFERDTLLFGPGISMADVVVSRGAWGSTDLIFQIRGTTDRIVVQRYAGVDPAELSVRFFDGAVWDGATIERQLLPASGGLVQGSTGPDTLQGSDGDDVLYGGDGDDRLHGSGGNDVLSGGAGNDTYYFGAGGGSDRIQDNPGWYGTDTNSLQFARGIDAGHVQALRNGLDLVLRLAGSADQITLDSYFALPAGLFSVHFQDGLSWNAGGIARMLDESGDFVSGSQADDDLEGGLGDDFLSGMGGNDRIHGGAGNDRLEGDFGRDTYYFGLGDGRDRIQSWGEPAEDTIVFGSGITLADVTASRVYDDLVLSIEGTQDRLTIENYFWSPSPVIGEIRFADGAAWDAQAIARKLAPPMWGGLSGSMGEDILDGGPGADSLFGGDGDDRLHGDRGDDLLYGGSGRDTYYFGGGDGDDAIEEYGNLESNILVFGREVLVTDVIASAYGADLLLQIRGTSDQITVRNQFWSYVPVLTEVRFVGGFIWDAAALQRVAMATNGSPYGGDGIDVLEGGPGDDYLSGGGGDDLLHGGAGNDWLSGGAGNDTYYFGRGGGQDVIQSDFAPWGTQQDTLVFGSDITLADVVVSSEGDDLVLALRGTDDLIRMRGYMSPSSAKLAAIRFADGASWDAAAIQGKLSQGTTSPQGSAYGDTLDGGLGDDTLYGGFGDDFLFGDAGNDFLAGSAGNDTYYFAPGSGHDVVFEQPGADADFDVVQFGAGIAPEDLRFGADGNALVMTFADPGDSLLLANVLGAYYNSHIDRLRFSGGAQIVFERGSAASNVLFGTEGRDVFVDGPGTDQLRGLGGDDLYIVRDWSQDTYIDDSAQPGAGNQLVLPAWTALDDIELSYAYGSLQLRLKDYPGVVSIAGFDHLDPLGPRAIDRFELSGISIAYDDLVRRGFTVRGDGYSTYLEGTPFDDVVLGTNLDEVLSGLDGNDVLYGGANSDTLHGNAGNDALHGDGGNDSLIGGTGSDTYYVDRTSGRDSILELEENPGDVDQLVFGAGIHPDDLIVTADPYSALIVEIGTSGASVRFNAWFYPGLPSHVERFVFEGGLVLSDAAIEAMRNHAPQVAAGIGDQVTDEDQEWIFQVPAGAFADYDLYDQLFYTASLAGGAGLPSWLSFDAQTLTFRGSPGNGDVGKIELRVTATDHYGLDASDAFSVAVRNINDAPYVAAGVADQSAVEDLLFTYAVPEGAFADIDAGDALTYSAAGSAGAPLPTWLSFDPVGRVFRGTPAAGDIGSLQVRVTATDSRLASASASFALAVQAHPGLSLVGTSGPDALTGKSGNDSLNGLGGGDRMAGKRGDDTYYVDNAADLVVEAANEGRDSVYSSISYTLPTNVEELILTGSAALAGNGNASSNRLIGNSGVNTLNGGGGDDVLDGGLNRDTMAGGTGDDTYVVDNPGDKVTENANEGFDTVRSSVAYTLPSNVENLLLVGAAAINGTGNGAANAVFGNAQANNLTGAGGNDLLQGLDGADGLGDTSGNAMLDGGAGNDTLTGGSGRELLIGGFGTDILNTGSGADVIAFNRGDGLDLVNRSSGSDNTLSLGGGLRYADLVLMRTGSQLQVEVSPSDHIIFADWYVGSSYRSVARLQVVAESMDGYDPASPDALLDHKLQTFDFRALVSYFDQERAANPGIDRWSAMHRLLDVHLAGSDYDALGGDLAYQYGLSGSLAGIGVNAAQDVVQSAQFAVQAQPLRPLAEIQSGGLRLL